MVIGVRFTIENGMLYVQIREGRLLPFGQTKPNKDWTPVKENPSSDETATLKVGCKFLLVRQWIPQDQVLVGVQLATFERDGECSVFVVVQGQQADLLEGQFLDYRNSYFVARYDFNTFIAKICALCFMPNSGQLTASLPYHQKQYLARSQH